MSFGDDVGSELFDPSAHFAPDSPIQGSRSGEDLRIDGIAGEDPKHQAP